jgi:hypothetical protein
MVNDARDSLTARLELREQQLLTIYAELEQTSPQGTGSPRLTQPRTSEAVRAEARQVSAQLAALQTPQGSPGEVIAAGRVQRSSDRLVIGIASGGAVGLMIGFAVVRLLDRNRRLARRAAGRTIEPVVEGLVVVPSTALGAATRYAPLAGAVPDNSVEACRTLARDIEDHLAANAELSGRRVVLVVSPRSTQRRIHELRVRCQELGLEPIGIVLTDDMPQPGERETR